MSKVLSILLGCCFVLFIATSIVLAEEKKDAKKSKEETKLEEIVVTGEKIIAPTKQTAETVYTGTEITEKGIEISGEKGMTNVYEVISIIPGVVFESPDANNLATEQAKVRIRGVSGSLGAMTVDGIPNYGGNPMGPRAYIYDMENFESIAVYKGAVPADLGSGVGNRGGAIELRPRWANKKFGVVFAPSIGNFDYNRTFLRLDSGAIGSLNSRFSLSYSLAEENKWKGPGEIGPRNNFNFTLVQPIGKNVEIKLWSNFNEIKQYNYRSLTYNQIKNLDDYWLDFNNSLTGNPGIDYNYFKFNKEDHKNFDLFSSIAFNFNDNLKLELKPYYSKEDAHIWTGSPNIQSSPGIQKNTRDIKREGIISEIILNLSPVNVVAGYHFESADMNIYTENYWINPGGSLTYGGYGVFGTTGTTYTNSPYLKLAGTINRFNWQVGMKYFRFKDSDSKGYVTKLINGTPVLVRAPDLDRDGKTYDIWLPTAGVSYKLNDNLETYLSYGRNFIRPYAYLPLVSLYNRLRPKFQAAGVTLNDMFKGYDIERSDNIDLGIRFCKNFIEVNPTVFFSKQKNLLTVISDPRVIDPSTGKPVNYQQNVGKATGYGFEIGTNLFLSDWLTFFVNPTYNHLTYDGDITYSGVTYKTDGRQIVDVPRWTVSSGLIFKYKDFEITPMMQYIGKRYGDAEHEEKVPSYSVFNLKLAYYKEKIGIIEGLRISLEFDNIFNKKYVSVINAMDYAISGTTYYVGAPFSIKGGLSFKF